jgi:arylsulfatase A-like enzyme
VKQHRWNLVVICLDTFRFDLLNHQAPWSVELPHLDRLRQESVQFTQAFGEGEPTIPTRRAYFTGERSFPWRYRFDTKGMWPTGRGWHKIPPEQPTMAEVLLRQGYQTGLISDNYHLFKPTGNFTRGFLQYEFLRGYESDNYRGGAIAAAELAPYVRNPDPVEHASLVQYLLNVRGRKREEDWHTAQTFTRAASWLRDHQQSGTEPFFLWVDSFGPHEPWDPPRTYLKPYLSNPQFNGIEFIYPVGLTAKDLDEAEQQRVRELYLAYLTFVDHWVGYFLGVLAETGLDRRTIVMVVNDHGTELMDHGQFSKSGSHLYAHNTQLFWLIRHPEQQRGECSALVQNHDLFPTALALLHVPHSPVAGTNAWQWVEQRDVPQREYVITGWGSYASIRDGRWNYFANFEESDAKEALFDLQADPGEHVNVAQKYPSERQYRRQLLEEFLEQPLPARLHDQVVAGEAPIRVYLGSTIDQAKRDAGFV